MRLGVVAAGRFHAPQNHAAPQKIVIYQWDDG
jgi:hypothetical protein